MTHRHLAALALAIAAAYPAAASAQSNDELLQELKALKSRVEDLEKKLADKPAADKPQWGMTPEQLQDFNRISVKTEGLEDAIESQGLKNLKISGFVDPTYIYNKLQHRSGFQFLNRVDDDGYNYDNGYFGTLALDFQKEMEGGTKFRLTLMPNRGAGTIADPAGHSIVHEASISVPLTDLQTRLIAGQIPDWSGYEYTQPTTTKLVTRGLLLDFTEPTVYTGAGVEFIRGKWDIKTLLGQMNQTKVGAGRKSPMFAFRADYSKGEFAGFGFAGVHGKIANFTGNYLDADGNPADAPDSTVDLLEVDGYFTRGDLTLQGQVGFGRAKGASITAAEDGSLRNAEWWGISGLAAYKFIPRWEAVARFDYIDNHKNGGGLLQYSSQDPRNGFGPDGNLYGADGVCDRTLGDCDKGANRYALALGVNYLLTPNTTIKAEYRIDRASLPTFIDTAEGTYSKTNQIFGTSVVVSF